MKSPDTEGVDRASDEPSAVADPWERQLLSSVCHDLKEPLASIITGAGFLRKVVRTEDAMTARVLESIHRAAERMSRRITTFSELARVQMNDLAVDLRPHPLGGIVRTVFEQLARDGADRHVSVTLDSDLAAPLQLTCDHDRLVQTVGLLGFCVLRVVPERASVTLRACPDGRDAIRFELHGRRSADGARRALEHDFPKPELALATGLIALQGGALATACDDDSLAFSFAMPRAADG